MFELNTFGGNDTLAARGTQVGSEGVKAPTMADDQMNVSGYNVKAAAVVVLIGANNDGFAETSPLGGGA